MRFSVTLIAVLGLIGTGGLPLSAATQDVLVYQGQIQDASKVPLQGIHELKIFYFAPGQLQPLYQEKVADVPFSKGHFEIKLGAGKQLPGGTLNSLGEVFSTFPRIEMKLFLDGKAQEPRMTIRPAGFSQADLAALAGHVPGKGEKHWEGYRVPSSGTAVEAVVFRPVDSKAPGIRTETNPFLLQMNYLGISPAVRDLPRLVKSIPCAMRTSLIRMEGVLERER